MKLSSGVIKAVSDNKDDCKKMAEALKAATPDDAKIKALDEWEAKQKADPALKKALDEAMEKSVQPFFKDFMAGTEKCQNDPEVKPLMEKLKNDDKKEEAKPEEKKEEPKK